MTKYVANAMLATKISFINEMANLCEALRRRHQRRPPRHRPRRAHRLQLPLSRRRLRRQLLSQGRPRAHPHGAASAACPRAMMEAVDAVNEAQKHVLVHKIREHFGDDAGGQDAGGLGPGLQAAHRRHPRGAGAGPDRRAAGRRGRAARPRPRGDGQRPGALRRPADLLRPALRRAGGGRRPGDRHRVAGVPQSRLRGDAPPAARAGHLRRPQPLRARDRWRPSASPTTASAASPSPRRSPRARSNTARSLESEQVRVRRVFDDTPSACVCLGCRGRRRSGGVVYFRGLDTPYSADTVGEFPWVAPVTS